MTSKQSQWAELLSSNKKIALFIFGITALLSTFIINCYVSTYLE